MNILCLGCGEMHNIRDMIMCLDCRTAYCEVCYVNHVCSEAVIEEHIVMPLVIAH